MRNYEVVAIFHPDLDENALTAAIEKIKGWMTDAQGTVTKVDLWGRRRLAYELRKQKEGQYVLFEAQLPPASTSELERNLRFLEPVMRFMIKLVE
ncbi:MAG TPA: 30S ribosomal protein S6 [Anaerolineaceae bacterium]|nr:30S ribosomal protein S6 [Anaerolineaceae bacterium]HPN52393.1 30S ribosomal protein S6 [Anaerolineaceae bacterium]